MGCGHGDFEDDYVQKPGIRYPSSDGKSLDRYAQEAHLVQRRYEAQSATARGFDSTRWDEQVDEALDALSYRSTSHDDEACT